MAEFAAAKPTNIEKTEELVDTPAKDSVDVDALLAEI